MQSESTLPSLFSRALGNYLKIKKTGTVSTDDKFRELIQDSCAICQEAIQMINQLELFSKNELLEDLSTQSIRYLTLPAFLAFFNGQKTDREERLTTLKLAQTYYDEFLDFLDCYGIPDLPKRQTAHDFSGDGANSKSKPSVVRWDPNAVREEKIRAYKAKKALEQRLENFHFLDTSHVDDEVLREESLAIVRYWAYTAVEELKLISEEVAILLRFLEPQGPSSPFPPPPPPPISRQPPLLITREEIQAAVFGAGYPSLPTMTLDHFVELQVQQGLMPLPQPAKGNKVNNKGGTWRRINPSETAEVKQEAETRAAKEDALEDAYSEEQRAKARKFDEFKDEHRRGSGNRANRG
uniref:Immunoglobulin binding protein 1 n=1 Tax=Echinococcus granulosus TaxID=6210 RepID=A0A068WRX4_ECHGR|nr:immunoglobulin binding protein 1 [Echinococcus granulosus]